MSRTIVVRAVGVFILVQAVAIAGEYDPLAISETFKPRSIELDVQDKARERKIPIKVYLPPGNAPAPVVLFSHGLGGSRHMGAYLGEHWSARGYATVFLQHPGSDDSVWRGEAIGKRLTALRDAASGENLLLRLGDVPAVLDAFEKWNTESGHALANRLDMKRVGMSGHSFGALTTQGVSGQSIPLSGKRYTDSRIKAAVVMSPGSPRAGDPKAAFGDVKTPWLLMTGTNDTARIGGQTVESRLAVFPALPEGSKYELVLAEGTHSAFTDRSVPGERRNPNHHRVILSLSTAFWDAYLSDRAEAKTWLDGAGPAKVLESEDKWRKK